jgi:hypothetical protein
MRKKNLILLIVVVFLSLFFLRFLYFDYFNHPASSPEEPECLTNITELYSYFTDYMKETVDSYLETINCNPEKYYYYYDKSAFCFICKEMHACFGFGLVQRAGAEKMNPKGSPYLKNYEKISVVVADFYKHGLASLFECVEKDNETLSCTDEIVFVKDYDEIRMMLNDQNKLKDVSDKICAHYGNSLPDCEESMCSCGDKQIMFSNGQLFVYDVLL